MSGWKGAAGACFNNIPASFCRAQGISRGLHTIVAALSSSSSKEVLSFTSKDDSSNESQEFKTVRSDVTTTEINLTYICFNVCFATVKKNILKKNYLSKSFQLCPSQKFTGTALRAVLKFYHLHNSSEIGMRRIVLVQCDTMVMERRLSRARGG